ncbi:aldose epimerase family protein [Shouchella patagoniensis]|uniref:aldose epimerase family protein n=1 Tax=Shouchella patagoniensis TaxID=228576 RepID=UPI000995BB64|nr:aldose epimerase family protein [Shouchella patagoniensis]
MQVTKRSVKNDWTLFTLENDRGMSLDVLDFGGVVTRLTVPDRHGKSENIVLAFDDIDDYKKNKPYFGALIGPVAGRIQQAMFTLGEKKINLKPSEGRHELHGGEAGYHQKLWNVESFQTDTEVGVVLQGSWNDRAYNYPGSVQVTVTYTLTNDNEWIIAYQAITDEMTPLTLTNHTYFNLTGDRTHSIAGHQVQMKSEGYLELDEELIPTGLIDSGNGGPFDFSRERLIKSGSGSGHKQNQVAGDGYDHYFLLKKGSAEQVRVKEPTSGRVLSMETTQPGVVFYTGNGLNEDFVLSDGKKAKKHSGFCLEAQGPPASLHHKGLPSIWLKPGEEYKHQTVYRFSMD